MTKFDNFLIYYIWPKELKQLVVRYRAEGCLNDRAIEQICRRTNKNMLVDFLIIVFFLSLPVFLDSEYIILFSAVIILITACSSYFQIREFFGRYLLALNVGDICEGRLLKVDMSSVNGAHSGWLVKYEYSNDGKNIKKRIHLKSNDDYDYSYVADDKLPIFIHKKTGKSIPAFKSILSQYSLKQEDRS